uniref:RNA-directed RNA polymerase n=1 Tax=Mudumu virus TaxID=2841875 RepID=A0A8E8R7L1_9REOV|nr:RNA-dependent RNA polymerase [Mudumu virus]
MAVVEHRLKATRAILSHIFPDVTFDGKHASYQFYKYSESFSNAKKKNEKTKNEFKGKGSEHQKDPRNDNTIKYNVSKNTFLGRPVVTEITWEDMVIKFNIINTEGNDTLSIYLDSLLEITKLDPEEEFLRNYNFEKKDEYPELFEFIMHRSRNECAVFGDMALRHWCVFLFSLSVELNFFPLGVQVVDSFISKFGSPFHQNTRDVSKIEDEKISATVVLLFEMCITESLLEFNILLRTQEEQIDDIKIGTRTFKLYELAREFFIICLPHPKKINNMLRAPYSWYVKTLGTACEKYNLLTSRAGDDRNSKDVRYLCFQRFQNRYANLLRNSQFHKKSLNENKKKIDDAVDYANSLLKTSNVDLPIFKSLFSAVYTTDFDPSNMSHVLFTSYLLSLQVITGYGRAWVKNKGDNPDIMLQPASDNFVDRVCNATQILFQRAYEEAERNRYTIVKPEQMYSSLLRLAKNTSSGMATQVDILKSYSPKGDNKEVIKISSRQKALVIMREGNKIFQKEALMRKFNTTNDFQTKGQRDVPIKSTRTIYAIHISVLAPQLLLTLPLNEYFAQFGGNTSPSSKTLGGKVIIGDLEATGCRVIDASDTFRNSGDPDIITFALDYSDYDQHMTKYNFRTGMLNGIRSALAKYSDLRYDGYTINDLIEFGYGEGRIQNTLWSGRRRVVKISRSTYELLPEERKTVPDDAPFKFRPPGTYPVNNVDDLEPTEDEDCLLVVPWDGSDLASVSTHLSGENSTLVANSLHNMAIGSVMREEINKHVPDFMNVLSEMYVGDDMLWYTRIRNVQVRNFDQAMEAAFESVRKSGHEAAASKTTVLPVSAEKTQTHAKHGIYIPQDRMMMVSSEKKKEIENIAGYMRSNVMTYITKVSRGFSEELAHRILLFKSSIIGYRKLKRTIYKDNSYCSRRFFSEEDGYTLCIVRDPSVLYTPVEWNGYGASPIALNIVMTPELYLDMMQMTQTAEWVLPLSTLINRHPPQWNETEADKNQIKTNAEMGLFSKLARPAVVASLMDPVTSASVRELPLQGFGPHSLSKTMIHNALLKEPRARSLLAPGYELVYQKTMNEFRDNAIVNPIGHDLEITTRYAKIFEIRFGDEIVLNTSEYPDRNLSHRFRLQKLLLGNRTSNRLRMSYVDKIDSILRSDIVMRGFITSNHILRLLEDLGPGHTCEDLATIFTLMNIEQRTATRLAEYLTKDQTRFDMQKLSKGGVGGDEFTMSLNVLTQEFYDKVITCPIQLFQAEKDALILHASQILMTRAALGMKPRKMEFIIREEHKKQLRAVRLKSRLPRRRMIKSLCTDVRRLAVGIIENQFL